MNLISWKNAALAIALSKEYLKRISSEVSKVGLPSLVVKGPEAATLRGPGQIIRKDKVTWYLDVAHTPGKSLHSHAMVHALH